MAIYYHGSDTEFKSGSVLTPKGAHARHVYFTNDYEWAKAYGRHVYEVIPGKFNKTHGPFSEYRTRDHLTVKREI